MLAVVPLRSSEPAIKRLKPQHSAQTPFSFFKKTKIIFSSSIISPGVGRLFYAPRRPFVRFQIKRHVTSVAKDASVLFFSLAKCPIISDSPKRKRRQSNGQTKRKPLSGRQLFPLRRRAAATPPGGGCQHENNQKKNCGRLNSLTKRAIFCVQSEAIQLKQNVLCGRAQEERRDDGAGLFDWPFPTPSAR